jgi:3-hydroxyisobutyrate dehydrogenase-like beta-hydroxyacid dehydrogenase
MTHLDTPMLGSQPQAVAGEIFFIVGGDPSALEVVAPYLGIMGKRHVYVGPTGTGNRVKLIHNGLAAVMSVAVAEALATCVQAGVDPYVFYEVVRQGGGMAYSTYFERRARRILDGDFTPTFMAALMLKDARLALEQARRAKVPAPLLEEAARTYEEAVAAGWGREDFSAVTHVIERRIGRRIGRAAASAGG